MTSSKCVRRRGVTRSSGLRGFFSPAGFWPFSPLSPFCACWACLGLSSFSGFGALSALSAFGGLLSLSAIDLNSRTLGDADLPPRIALAYKFEAHARRLAVLRIGERQIGDVNRRLLRDDPAFLSAALLLVALDDVDAAHERARLSRTHLDHLAGATFVAAVEHDHLVALLDFRRHHSTSGA